MTGLHKDLRWKPLSCFLDQSMYPQPCQQQGCYPLQWEEHQMWKHVLEILTANSETAINHHIDQLKGLEEEKEATN